jgi:hypothetical protein
MTEEQIISADHVVIAKNKETVAISEPFQERKEKVDVSIKAKVAFESAEIIKEHNCPFQLHEHIRFYDLETGDMYDVDVYLDTKYIRKFDTMKEEMKIKNIPYRIKRT